MEKTCYNRNRNISENSKSFLFSIIVVMFYFLLLPSYVVGGPEVSRSLDRRSYGFESVEDDPFILAASTQSLNSIDGGKRNKDPSVNYGYSSNGRQIPCWHLNNSSISCFRLSFFYYFLKLPLVTIQQKAFRHFLGNLWYFLFVFVIILFKKFHRCPWSESLIRT